MLGQSFSMVCLQERRGDITHRGREDIFKQMTPSPSRQEGYERREYGPRISSCQAAAHFPVDERGGQEEDKEGCRVCGLLGLALHSL